MKVDFEHVHAAHCENGVTRNLLRNIGVGQITEPLAFGIGAGYFFCYIPLLKINGGPAIAYRSLPGQVFKKTCKSLGIPVFRKKFSSEEKAQQHLDDCLAKGMPVGCQVGVYYLPYFPKEYRFHFNAHNLVVYGKEGDEYLVSDPVMEETTRLSTYELNRVRFSKGPLAPKGQLYYPETGVDITDGQIVQAIKRGINKTIKDMLHIPGPIAGISGIKYTAKRIGNWRKKFGPKVARSYLAQVIRMQEEIGTGGGGFRFIYAAFLQEAAQYIPDKGLEIISEDFTKAGDLWRNVAVQAAGIYKGRLDEQKDYDHIRDLMTEIADIEAEAFRKLEKLKL